ncbi:DUF4198 domain-containing protein [Aeromonas sp. BIGb0445]|uniref:DUF4198 domain-containing protein n=1 Tax=Aeromonas sp. BIGb0445 TaxID=2940593 RepID=UPI002166CB6D|nr:DUF4198 domain-containing protein [Aeromonas sp. BIGb0445]MCS3458929.1 putative GH25 family protein [Aeromonas sp. BIGb0445]
MMAPLYSISALAHEFWLVPHPHHPEQRENVSFELRIGPTWPGTQTPRLPNLVASFSSIDALGTQEIAGRDGSRVIGHLRPRTAGATLVALRTHEAAISLTGPEFNQYLAEEGLDKILEQRRVDGSLSAPGKERFSRCAKSILLVDGQSQGFDRVVGMPLELVPLTEPLHYQAGEPFSVKLLHRGQPLADTLIKAQLKTTPPVELKARSDADGVVIFQLPHPGLWLFNAVDMSPAADLDSDWQSLWASLTFWVGTTKIRYKNE